MERTKVGNLMKARAKAEKKARMKAEKKARMKSASMKAKGRALQKWVCEKISYVTGFPCGKDSPIESRPMGQAGVDVRLETSVLDLFPFSVECKNQEAWAVPAWIRQAKDNQVIGTNWIVFAKKNRERPVAIMDAEEFFLLYKNYIDAMEVLGKIKRPTAPPEKKKRERT